MTKKVLATGGVLLLASLPLLSLAQFEPPATPNLRTVGNVIQLLRTIFGWIQTIFWILAAVFIILTAFKYLTAQGDEEKIKSAKQMLIYTIIAIAVALFALVAGTIVSNFLSGQ